MRTWDSLKLDCPIKAVYVQHSRLAGERKSVRMGLFSAYSALWDCIYIVTRFSDNHIGYDVPAKSHNMLYIFRFRTVCSTLAAV